MKPAKTQLVGSLVAIEKLKRAYLWTMAIDSLAVEDGRPLGMQGRVALYLARNARGHGSLPKAGTRLRVYCSLEPFRDATNPHEFASDRKLQQQLRADAQGHIASRFDYYLLSGPRESLIANMADALTAAHQALLTLLDSSMTEPTPRGFVEAVVLGDRSDMDKETLNDFTTSGVAHILAVSGFNVAIVALVVAQLLRLFGIYWFRTRISITMAMVLLYSAIVGFQPSVVRALLMIELYLVAQLFERRPDPLNIVMSAAAINLMLRPFDLFDVGFQLSYAGVLGMVLIAPKIRWLFSKDNKNQQGIAGTHLSRWQSRWATEVGSAAALSIGASIASYPVIATHFYRVSFIGLAANLPLVPLSAIVTALGFLLIPLAALSHWLGQLYGEATVYLTQALLWLTRISAHVPHAAHAAAQPSWILLGFFVGIAMYVLTAKSRKQVWGRVVLSGAALFTLWEMGVPFSNSIVAQHEGKLQVLFFDVGQGDCILLHTPNGKNYFVDFGRADYSGAAVIERTAVPFLRAEDITQVDGGFISHMQIDHYGGAAALIENCRVATLLTSGERVPSASARELDSESNDQHVATRILSLGDTVELDSELTLYVLHPEREVRTVDYTNYGENLHTGMLAFKVVYRKTSFLFLGDLERSEEETMLTDYGTFLHSDVVKVAHHGSLTSSSKEFIAATNPRFAVISVGEYNRFGHPAPAIVKRWMTGGATICRTDHEGAVLFVSDGNSVQRVKW